MGYYIKQTIVVDHTRAVFGRIEHLVESALDARRGGLADLVITGHPGIRLSDVTPAPATRGTMTASALARELPLLLVTIHLDALTSKYVGEVAVKLRVIYDAMSHPRTLYLFDGLDAIEARPESCQVCYSG